MSGILNPSITTGLFPTWDRISEVQSGVRTNCIRTAVVARGNVQLAFTAVTDHSDTTADVGADARGNANTSLSRPAGASMR